MIQSLIRAAINIVIALCGIFVVLEYNDRRFCDGQAKAAALREAVGPIKILGVSVTSTTVEF